LTVLANTISHPNPYVRETAEDILSGFPIHSNEELTALLDDLLAPNVRTFAVTALQGYIKRIIHTDPDHFPHDQLIERLERISSGLPVGGQPEAGGNVPVEVQYLLKYVKTLGAQQHTVETQVIKQKRRPSLQPCQFTLFVP
jgi:hypothetical protein